MRFFSSMSRPVTAALVLAGMMAGTSDTAMAQQGGALRQACAADYRSLCSGTKPGGGRILACFKTNADKLSPGCKQALASARQNQGQ
ncbi:MAG TPA: cysteine rich repeat-containing protein [Stellaceae bacterium]|jgi:hypothetical protein|nr:cysteine rich repeat-containing protein [Stellaceae bacterium]